MNINSCKLAANLIQLHKLLSDRWEKYLSESLGVLSKANVDYLVTINPQPTVTSVQIMFEAWMIWLYFRNTSKIITKVCLSHQVESLGYHLTSKWWKKWPNLVIMNIMECSHCRDLDPFGLEGRKMPPKHLHGSNNGHVMSPNIKSCHTSNNFTTEANLMIILWWKSCIPFIPSGKFQMCELLELVTAVTNTIFTSVAYVNFKALLMLYMQLLGHSPATQKIKTGQKVPNLSENSLYITFGKKTIQKYGIFLSHSPLIKSLQQSIRFLWSQLGRGQSSSSLFATQWSQKGNIRPLVHLCVRSKSDCWPRGILTPSVTTALCSYILWTPLIGSFRTFRARTWQHFQANQIYKIVKMQREGGITCNYTDTNPDWEEFRHFCLQQW